MKILIIVVKLFYYFLYIHIYKDFTVFFEKYVKNMFYFLLSDKFYYLKQIIKMKKNHS